MTGNDWIKPFEVPPDKAPPPRSSEPPAPKVLATEGEAEYDKYLQANTFREDEAATPTQPVRRKRSPLKWVLVFAAVLLITVLGLDGYFLLRDYYARSWWAGALATLPLAALAISLLWLAGRELRGYLSLRSTDQLRDSANHVRQGLAPPGRAIGLVRQIATLYAGRDDIRPHYDTFLDSHSDTHTDAEVLGRFSRDVLRPIDEQAYALIARHSVQAAMLTTVSPFASTDALLTLWRNSRMIRELATLYGVRPGLLRNVVLARNALEALMVAGASDMIADTASETIGNQVVGALSARLGSGISNGLMTARLGMLVVAECRPLPFTADEQHSFREVRKRIAKAIVETVRKRGREEAAASAQF